MYDVTIVIANYNYGKYLSRCLRSCLGQVHVSKEIIVVDDNSCDNSKDIVSTFSKDITFIQNAKNMGVAEASNVGINASKSQYVVRVDADDFINCNLCFFLRTYLTCNHDNFCVSSDYYLIDENEEEISRMYAEVNPISCGIMYKRDMFVEYGGYNKMMRHREEDELRKRLGNKYTIGHMRIPFYRYRMHMNNKTKSEEYKHCKV